MSRMTDASASNKSHVNSNLLNSPFPQSMSDNINEKDILYGGFGLAFPYKGFMYKVFFNKDNPDKIEKKVKDTLNASRYLKNDHLKTSKKYEISFSTLPVTVQQTYFKHTGDRPLNVFVIRMHMLGIDLLNYSNNFFKKKMKPYWSIEQLFQLCIKCSYDNYCLYKNNHTHGDVDFENIVCEEKKTDGAAPDLSLLCRVIDFDHFGTRDVIFIKLFNILYLHFERDYSNIKHLPRHPPIFLYIFYNNKFKYNEALKLYSEEFFNRYERFLPEHQRRSKQQIETEINTTMQNMEDTSINYDIDTFSYGNILSMSIYTFLHDSDWTDSRIVELYTIIEQMISFSQSERITPLMAFLLIVECANKHKISLSFIPDIQEKIQLEYDEAKLKPEEDKNSESEGAIKILREYRKKMEVYGYKKFKDFFESQYQMRKKKDIHAQRTFECVKHILYEIYRDKKDYNIYDMDINKEYVIDRYIFDYMDSFFINDVIYGLYTKEEIERIYGNDIWDIVSNYTIYKKYDERLKQTNIKLWFILTILLSIENLYNNPKFSTVDLTDIATFLNSNIQSISNRFPENEQILYLGVFYYIYFLINKKNNNIPYQIVSLTKSAECGYIISEIELVTLSKTNEEKIHWLRIAKKRLDMIPSYMLTGSYKKREIIEEKKNKIDDTIKELQSTTTASYTTEDVKANQGGRRALRKRTHRKKRELRKRTLRKNRTKRRA